MHIKMRDINGKEGNKEQKNRTDSNIYIEDERIFSTECQDASKYPLGNIK